MLLYYTNTQLQRLLYTVHKFQILFQIQQYLHFISQAKKEAHTQNFFEIH